MSFNEATTYGGRKSLDLYLRTIFNLHYTHRGYINFVVVDVVVVVLGKLQIMKPAKD